MLSNYPKIHQAYKNVLNILTAYTWGEYALVSFILCVFSGFALLVPYNASNAYDSVSLMILANPAAAYFRNLHYLTAQFFLVSTIIHLWKYISSNNLSFLKTGIWFRLVLSVLFLFFVMITGFILKGDADSQQALLILVNLFKKIPLVGDSLQALFLGDGESLHLVYYHHISTASIVLLVVIYEHSRRIWVKTPLMASSILVFSILSVFIQAPLHDGKSLVMKGPWYFLGLQELLHWLENPVIALVWMGVAIILFYLLYYRRALKTIKTILFVFVIIYSVLSLLAIFFRGAEWKWVNPFKVSTEKHIVFSPVDIISLKAFHADSIPMMNGFRESCISCHSDMSGFSNAHDPKSIGCSSCHLGNPYAYTGWAAHSGMILVPGNLAYAPKTCGRVDCHSGIPDRVSKSLMSTLSGMISVNRWVFNETDHPSIQSHVTALGISPADMHLRNLCSGCHLGTVKSRPGPGGSFPKGGGCNACHLNYSDSAKKEVISNYWINSSRKIKSRFHPSLSSRVGDDKCFHCHNRSGRISMNYKGWAESIFEKPVSGKRDFTYIDGARTFRWAGNDVHHAAGMSCIDCHQSVELMGDGQNYSHKEEAVKVECTDCHGAKNNSNRESKSLSSESQKIIALNQWLKDKKQHQVNEHTGLELVNARRLNEETEITLKLNGLKRFAVNPSPDCNKGKSHNRLSCSSCHTTWASSCVGCHISFDSKAQGYDHLKNKMVKGSWTEAAGKFEVKPPALGIRKNKNGNEEIHTFIPGMVLKIELTSSTAGNEIFKRLYAPAEPHTIGRKARSCASCHQSSFALGYGEGNLEYVMNSGKASWVFSPKYANEGPDNLPADAWVGFLKDRTDASSTRPSHRPFTKEEQKRILMVGACLQCHPEKSTIMELSLTNFDSVFSKRSARCVLPFNK